jgi:uncharacterized membrane protein YeaQ/YmgE (transglycosylase-associated protein family)
MYMSPLLWFVLIGLVAGWLVGQLSKGEGLGILADLVIGMVGAILGGFLLPTIGVSGWSGLLDSLIVATFGAVVFVFAIHQFKKA